MSFFLNKSLMKFFAFACFLLTFQLVPDRGLSQTAITIGWDMSTLIGGSGVFGASPLSPTATDPGVTLGGLTRGSGVTQSGSGANRAWGGTGWLQTSEATAISANSFATFSLTPTAGNTLSLSSITLSYRRSGTGAASGELQYAIGAGAFTDISALTYASSAATGATLPPVSLTSITALQNMTAGTIVTFRIVNWGGTGTGVGTWYVFDAAISTGLDLAIAGTVTSTTSAADYYSKSTGNLDATATWGTNTDGSGTAPADFTTASQTFHIANSNPGSFSGSTWTVSGTSSKIILP